MPYKIALWTAVIAAFAVAGCKPGGADQGPVIRIGSATTSVFENPTSNADRTSV